MPQQQPGSYQGGDDDEMSVSVVEETGATSLQHDENSTRINSNRRGGNWAFSGHTGIKGLVELLYVYDRVMTYGQVDFYELIDYLLLTHGSCEVTVLGTSYPRGATLTELTGPPHPGGVQLVRRTVT